MQPCNPLSELTGKTGKDLTKNIADNAAIYHECADSKLKLVEAIRKK